ncbi:MAG: 4a-hydroxytetrahydrobiopterin dehydratase [Microcoleaceae cyanobacterium]
MQKKKPLSEAEISQGLKSLSNWEIKNHQLTYTHQFKNFVEAINFVNCLIIPTETANHHPDLVISYNQVTINLITHDLGELTAQDFDMATTISQLIQTWKSDKTCNGN